MNNCEKSSMDITGVKCLEHIQLAIDAIRETIKNREVNKLSVRRFSAISRELSELIKVLKCYTEDI